MHRVLLERIANGETSILSKGISEGKQISLDDIIDAINKEDPLCIEILEEVGSKLGKHIASVINVFNPELVIIGGKLSLAEDYLTEPIKSAIRKYSLNLVNRDSAIASSKLKEKAGVSVYNLGTGNGYSVLDMVKAVEKACGKEIPYEIKPRREGDIATCYCDATKAKNELHWVAERGLDEMCEDAWRWQSQNPNGYNE